jgi:threonine dehydrogenase-like Zn-dependent dehydrogenase
MAGKSEKLERYRRGDAPLPEKNIIWPLYGAGFENLGRDGRPIEVPMPEYSSDELLVRHDACGHCFSDIKVIRLGEDHPRIYRDMNADPVVLGHEVCMTVVGVGEDLRDRYKVGDRITLQTDIYVDGVGYAYGYEIQGGLSLYTVIDQRVMNNDQGNFLIPIKDKTGYAESALVEPWACVVAAYRLTYRTSLKGGGTTWIIGTGKERPYTISAGFDEDSHPARLLLTKVPPGFASMLKEKAQALGVEVVELADVSAFSAWAGQTQAGGPVKVDDLVFLGADPDLIEEASPHLANFGVAALLNDEPIPRKVQVDVGRVHYNRWVYIGGTDPDIGKVYGQNPVRSTLKPGGRVWFVGAGGPMGRMHVSRAIGLPEGPATVVCTDVSAARLTDLDETMSGDAEARGIEFLCLNPKEETAYQAGMAPFVESGFDDIVVMVPVPAVIADAASYLAQDGLMDVFAGVARGTQVKLDLNDAIFKNIRVIGHSASSYEDMRFVLNQVESGQLATSNSVAAIGSLNAAYDGLKAVANNVYPGKIVVFPHIKDFPLTALPDLKDKLPSVYARLKNGREWTLEAEEEFLSIMLPDD